MASDGRPFCSYHSLARRWRRGHLIGLRLPQVRLQNIGEEVVIAIPLALVIERNDKQIAALQGIQHFSAIFPPSDGIAQRSRLTCRE